MRVPYIERSSAVAAFAPGTYERSLICSSTMVAGPTLDSASAPEPQRAEAACWFSGGPDGSPTGELISSDLPMNAVLRSSGGA
jgi:hypothetical protein